MSKSKKKKGTKQTLEFVEEPKKFRVKPIKYRNPRQKELVEAISSNEIVMAQGGAGSGKSYAALYAALKLLEKGETDQIVLVKSVTTLPGEEIGYLCGDMNSKLSPFMLSFTQNIDRIIGKDIRIQLEKEEKIIVQPLAYVRGISAYRQTFIIDEVQNFNLEVFKTIITRIGEDCHFIFLGDTFQIDLKNKQASVFSRMLELFKDNIEGFYVMNFLSEDQARNPIITKILKILEQL